MKWSRRAVFLGTLTTAISSAWSRTLGARISRPPTPAPIPPARHYGAGDHLDRIYRDLYRRLIDPAHFDRAFTEAISILRRSSCGELAQEEAAAYMLAVHSEALRRRPPDREIPQIPADQVGVHEAMAVLRRVITGESIIHTELP
jgi:hypothetical protein